jgi:hypothetical protein
MLNTIPSGDDVDSESNEDTSNGEDESSSFEDETQDIFSKYDTKEDTDSDEKYADEDEETSPDVKVDDDLEEDVKKKPKLDENEEDVGKGRAQKRIRQLITQQKEAESRYSKQMEGLRQQQQQFQQQVWQQQQQYTQQQQEMDKQYAIAQKELEMLRQQRELADEASLDPVERLKRETMRDALKAAEAKLMPQIEEERRYRQQMEQQWQKQQHETQVRERIGALSKQNEMAASTLMDGFSEQQRGVLRDSLETFILNWSASNNVAPQAGAKEFDRFATQYVRARDKARAQKTKLPRSKASAVPADITRHGRKGTTGKGKRVTYAQAREAGFDNVLDFLASQED